MSRLLLIGGGHAHLQVIRSFLKVPSTARVTLVSPAPRLIYSGMLPGVVAGHYDVAEAEIDIERLAARAGIEFVAASAIALDPARRSVRLSDGRELGYDIASLNVGSGVDASIPGSVDYAVAAKPMREFLEKAAVYYEARLAVVGGGAAGVELAMALRHRGNEVSVYSDRPAFAPALARRVAAALRRNRVSFIGMPVTRIAPGPVVMAGMTEAAYDAVVLATGAAPLPWLRASGLRTDEHGFVLVDRSLRSLSHPELLAAGDCATLADAPHPKSGVYAVRHGEAMLGRRPYRPQRHSLALITCGARYAIAVRGAWIAEGAWAWRWKDWIDRRWIRRFSA